MNEIIELFKDKQLKKFTFDIDRYGDFITVTVYAQKDSQYHSNEENASIKQKILLKDAISYPEIAGTFLVDKTMESLKHASHE